MTVIIFSASLLLCASALKWTPNPHSPQPWTEFLLDKMIRQPAIFRQLPRGAAFGKDFGLVGVERFERDAQRFRRFLRERAFCQRGECGAFALREARPHGGAARGVARGRRRGRQRGLGELAQRGEVGAPGYERHRHQAHVHFRRCVEQRALARCLQEFRRRVEVPQAVVMVAVQHRGARQREREQPRTARDAQVQALAPAFELAQQVARLRPDRFRLAPIVDGVERAIVEVEHPRLVAQRAPAIGGLRAGGGEFRPQLRQRPRHPRLLGVEVQDQHCIESCAGCQQRIQSQGDDLSLSSQCDHGGCCQL